MGLGRPSHYTHPLLCYRGPPAQMGPPVDGLFREGGPNSTATCLVLAHLRGNLILPTQGQNRGRSRKQGVCAGPWGYRQGPGIRSFVGCLQIPPHGSVVSEEQRWALPHHLAALPGA